MIKFIREFKINTRAKTAQQLPDIFLVIKFIYFVAFSEYMNFITKFIIREFIKNI